MEYQYVKIIKASGANDDFWIAQKKSLSNAVKEAAKPGDKGIIMPMARLKVEIKEEDNDSIIVTDTYKIYIY